jgi:hypothetical protein
VSDERHRGTDPAQLDDDDLLDLLGRALATTDPVPSSVVRAAVGAETWRTIDAELAELVFDSAVASTGTRSTPGSARELTFRAGGLEIELLLVDGPAPVIEGQLVPAVGDLVELTGRGAATAAEVDELGRFRFVEIPAGPVRFGIRTPGGWVQTAWVVLRAS